MSRSRKSVVDAASAADRSFAFRTSLLGVLFVTLLSLLSWRLIHIQYIQHTKFLSRVQSEHIDDEVLPARRGQVYDRNNNLIVANRIEETVYIDRYKIDNLGVCVRALAHAEGVNRSDIRRSYAATEIRQKYLERLGQLLAEPLGIQHWEIIREITQSKKSEIILAKKVDQGDAARLKDLLRAERISGVCFRDSHKRFYPFGNLATHIMGFISEGGNAGIESLMNSYLEGVDGHRVFETDRKGREIAGFRGDAVEPRHGHHVRLTIDMGLQAIVETALDEVGNDPDEIYVPKLGAEKVSVVLLEPGTGAIVAVANRPHFDVETRRGNWRNYAVCDQYDPGSTFKVATLAAALDSGLVSPHQRIAISPDGRLEEAGIRPIIDDHIYSELTVEGILIKSSNIGAYKLARQLGPERFYAACRKFGFGKRPGTGLPGESGGQFLPPKHWSKPSLSRKAMGYEVGATPLQMVAALSVIINDGVLYESRIVDAVFDEHGQVVESRQPKIVQRAISSETAQSMKKALAKVCLPGGTATRAVPPGFTAGGKTGTAQKFDHKQSEFMTGRYIVSFMGFVPADDPKLIGIVVVDDPRASRVKLYGGTIAAPIFRRIAGRAMEYLGVEPSEPTEDSNHELATSTHRTFSAY